MRYSQEKKPSNTHSSQLDIDPLSRPRLTGRLSAGFVVQRIFTTAIADRKSVLIRVQAHNLAGAVQRRALMD